MKKANHSVLRGVLNEESERLKSLSSFYHNGIRELPKGYIAVKRINGRKYVYLSFREKDRVRSKYIGKPSSDKAKQLKKQIERRKDYEAKLKAVKENLGEIKRLLRRNERKK